MKNRSIKPANAAACSKSAYYALIPFLLLSLLFQGSTKAQCGAGFAPISLNWDNLDYMPYSGRYSGGEYLSGLSVSQVQHFAMGRRRLTFSQNFSAGAILGENGTHTGETGSFASGDDVAFNGNGTITLSLDSNVQNLRFSLYDIDNNQVVTVTARNLAGVNQPVSMTAASTSSGITIVGSGTFTAIGSASGSGRSNSSNRGTLNIQVDGPVREVTIVVSGTAGDFWVSDISACDNSPFPTNYYAVSRPFTGQPNYVLHAFDKSVYAVDPATGRTRFLFTDPALLPFSGSGNRCYINSMAYDPYNHILYYVFSLSSNPGANRMLKKYDFNTETISTVLADINSIGVPTVNNTSGNSIYGGGVESGAGAFYDGSLYIGVETSDRNGSGLLAASNREAVIWRIDFDASLVPYRASQVFATPVDNGSGNLLHDWSDFVMSDGILYDFDGASNERDVFHIDMASGATLNTFHNPTGWVPGQPAVAWDGTVYQLHAQTVSPANNPYIAVYNQDGTLGTRFNLFSSPAFSPAIPSLGDAAEAFRPKGDFGDAPASYDPDPMAPATHEYDPRIRLGNTFDHEWNLVSSSGATADGADEDGIGAAPALNYDATLTYSVSINFLNNLGANATLAAWLDYNFNGVFDPGEGRVVNVSSSGSMQSRTLTWSGIWVPFTAKLQTYLRIRITKASNGMTVNDMNGWYADGEVEDYPVLLGTALPKDLLAFEVKKLQNQSAQLNWTLAIQQPVRDIEIQRSSDNQHWETLTTRSVSAAQGYVQFSYNDLQPLSGNSYYRLLINYQSVSTHRYSEIKTFHQDMAAGRLRIAPNPAQQQARVDYLAVESGQVVLQLFDSRGNLLRSQQQLVRAGNNMLLLDQLGLLPAGRYTVRLLQNKQNYQTQLLLLGSK